MTDFRERFTQHGDAGPLKEGEVKLIMPGGVIRYMVARDEQDAFFRWVRQTFVLEDKRCIPSGDYPIYRVKRVPYKPEN